MSRSPLWKRDAKGAEHPVQELLLSYIREQCTEREHYRIQEHLQTRCEPCNRLHAELKQSSHALNYLKHMSRYLYYPEVQSNQILLHMQRGEPLTSALTGKRKRKFQIQSRSASRQQVSRTGLRVFRLSFPVAFGLLLVFMTVAVVLAYTIASFMRVPLPLLWQPSGSFHANSGPYEADLYPHKTPTSIVVPTITPASSPSSGVTVTSSPTPTVTGVVGPGIDFCPPPRYSGQGIFVCGHGFNAGDKVSLVLDLYGSKTPWIVGSYKADKHGEFTAYLYFYLCSMVPRDIYARDVTLMPASVVSNTLTNIPAVTCRGPGPTPTLSVTPGAGW